MKTRFKVRIIPYESGGYKFCIQYSYGYFTFWRYLKSYQYSNLTILTGDLDKMKSLASGIVSIQTVRSLHSIARKKIKEKKKPIMVFNKEVKCT
jgi:hypothetical protein